MQTDAGSHNGPGDAQVLVGILTLTLSTWWISQQQQTAAKQHGEGNKAWTLSSYAQIAVFTLVCGTLSGQAPCTLAGYTFDIASWPACICHAD